MNSGAPEPAVQDRFPHRFPSLPTGVLLPLLAGLLLRLLFYLRFPHVDGDALVYGDIARNLLQHHVYGFSNTPGSIPPVRPTLIRLPGYPLFLALCFLFFGIERYNAVLLVQIAVDLATCLLIGRLAANLFGRQAGMAALWLAVLCPFTANYTAAALTETLTLFTITLAFYALERWHRTLLASGTGLNRWLYLLACALAYSILLRPEQGLLAAAIVPAVFLIAHHASPQRKTVMALKPALILSLLTVLPLVPWTLRNARTLHVFQPLAPRFATDPGEFNPTGFERWYRTWAVEFASTDAIYWRFDGSQVDVADLPPRAFDSPAQRAATAQLFADYNVSASATPELDVRFEELAQARIAAHPLRYALVLPAVRVANMILRPRTEMLPVPLAWWRFRQHPFSSLFAVLYAVISLVYFALAALTLAKPGLWRAHRILIGSMLTMMALRLALLLTIDNSEPRYTLELFPMLIVLAGASFRKASPGSHTASG